MKKVKVFAKLNLFLNVVGKVEGFHNLDTVFVSIDIFDTVTVTKRNDKLVCCNSFCGIEGQSNNATVAGKLFVEKFQTNGCDIFIEKQIPLASGLGGSSADVAGVLFALCKLYDKQIDDVTDIVNKVGSDVAFMLKGGFAVGSGRGNDLHFFDANTMHFVVTTFEEKLSTKEVFCTYSKIENPQTTKLTATEIATAVQTQNFESDMLFNSLEQASAKLTNCHQDYLKFCKHYNLSTAMTGSGSGYFIVCKNNAEAKKTAEILRQAGFCSVATQSVSKGIETH